MKKIIHMTDLHTGKKGLLKRFITIAENLKTLFPEDPDDYIIVITGDLVHSAGREHFNNVKRVLNDLKASGFRHILVIPGNHDYRPYNDRGIFYQHKIDEKYAKMFQDIFFDKSILYPILDVIPNSGGKEAIAFIGLDSMAGEFGKVKKYGPSGSLGDKQLTLLEEKLNSDKVKNCGYRVLYLHHHPVFNLPRFKLKDSEKFKKLIKRTIKKGISIDAMLYGHYHRGVRRVNKWGIQRCYDGGTATLVKHPLYKARNSTRIIFLDKDPRYDRKLDFYKSKNSKTPLKKEKHIKSQQNQLKLIWRKARKMKTRMMKIPKNA